jgi:GTP-binding protein
LALVIDASEDPEGAETILRAELHAAGLSKKPTIVILNKVDLLDDELQRYLCDVFPGAPQVSAFTGEGVERLQDLVEKRLQALDEQERVAGAKSIREHRTFRPTRKGLRVEKVEEYKYEVSGENIERLALRTDWESPEGVENFQRELERKGVVAMLKRAGAEPGDEVRIGETEFEFR